MLLKPDGKIDLEYRATFLRSTSHESVVIAVGQCGQFSVLSPGMKESRMPRLPSKIRAISPHPSDRRLAFVDGNTGSLIIQEFDGARLLEIAPLQVLDPKTSWIQRGFDDCFFSECGSFLWTIAPLNSEDAVVQLHEAETGVVIDTATVKDPFGGSSCSFHSTGKSDLICLWLAAGNPDMVQVYWLKTTRSGFTCTLEAQLRNAIPPIFSPSGDELLVVTADSAICKFTFPAMQQVGLPLKSVDNEDNPFAESPCYFSNRQALASTNEQRIFAVDTVRMEIETEVSLEGHEPRPIGQYYPRLSKETGLGTDISCFTRLGDVIVFVYRRDRNAGLEEWQDSLLWLRARS